MPRENVILVMLPVITKARLTMEVDFNFNKYISFNQIYLLSISISLPSGIEVLKVFKLFKKLYKSFNFIETTQMYQN